MLSFGGHKPARIRGWKHNSSQRLSCIRTQSTERGDGGLNKRRLDQAFQTRKSSNSQMFTERKMKGSNEHNEAFHAVRYSGMSHSLICDAAALDLSCFLHTLRSLSTDEGSSKCCPDLPGALPWPIQAAEHPSTG